MHRCRYGIAAWPPVNLHRGHGLVAQDAPPLLEALVRDQHGGGTLMAGVDEFEEQDRGVLAHGELIDLVHLKERGMGRHLEPTG